MLSRLAGLFLLLVALVNAEDTEKKYMLTFPNVLRSGMTFQAHLALLENVQTNVVANVSVRRDDDLASSLAWPDSAMEIELGLGENVGSSQPMMVPYNLPAGQQFFVHIEFFGLSIITEPQQVTSERPNPGVLVQTDKPIYKPSDMVRFRVLYVDKELKPRNEDITVQIKNPDGDIIVQKVSGPSDGDGHSALLTDEFELSDDPPLGEYKLITMTETAYDFVTFKVEEYVLPKFDVNIELEKNFGVMGKNSKVKGRVNALYSYGEEVRGKLVLSANGKSVLTDDNFLGSREFSLPVEGGGMPEFYFRGYYTFSQSMTVEAVVTEVLTDNEMRDTESFTVYDTDFKAMVVEPLPIYFDGTPDYSFQVKLTDPTGGDIDNLDLSKYMMKYSYKGNVETVNVLEENPMTLYIDIDTSDKNSDTYPSIEVWFLYIETNDKIIESKRTQVYPPTYFTAGNTELEVTLKPGYEQNTNIKCFQVSPFRAGDIAFYQILDNYDAGEVLPYTSTDGHCFSVLRKHTPKSMIVIYKVSTVTPPGMKENVQDLVTANLIVDIPWTPEQQVSLEISPETVEPGEDVTIRIQTNGKSYLALTAIDKSLTFLADTIDITQKGIRSVLESYRLFEPPEQKSVPNPMWDGPIALAKKKRKKRCFTCWNSDQYLDALTLLEESGLGVMTNLYIYEDERSVSMPDYPVLFAVDAMRNGGVEESAMVPDMNADNEIEAPKQKVRKDFREVWLWQLSETTDDGSLTLVKKVPDVITNWITSAFVFNNISGVAVATPQEITVFKDFFLSMNLPYSTVRGEIFDLELVVFNYMSRGAEINVKLYESDDYNILDRSVLNKRLIVKGSSSGIVKVPIQLRSIGMVKLRASASEYGSVSKMDIVERELLVKPEGREVDHDTGVQIKFPASQNEISMNLSSFFNEKHIVEDSIRMSLFVTGDVMGPSIASFESRIKMPYGCGEQNMQSLAPALFSALYLKTIDRLEGGEIKEKIGRVCGAGYRKELNFKHHDGSYSAFGPGSNICGCMGGSEETKGSTWLTGFVLKLFSLLYTNQMTYVDFDILEHAFVYLASVASPDCEDLYFEELGELIHTEMKGGTSSNYGFTAFILVAILDFRDAAIQKGNQTIINNANELIEGVTQWLIVRTDEILSSGRPYQMAIAAYALAKASNMYHNFAEDLLLEAYRLQHLDGNIQPPKSPCQAKPGNNNICRSAKDCVANAPRWGGSIYECCKIPCSDQKACIYMSRYEQERQTGATKIETYGYILMAALELDIEDLADEMSTILLTHRKVNGFFETTQDTTVALEALTRYSMKHPSTSNTDFVIKGKVDNSLTLPVVFNPSNYTVRTEVDLPVSGKPKKVSVVATSGQGGTAYINLVATYNVKENVTGKPLILILRPGQSLDGELGIHQCVQRNNESTIPLSTMIVVRTCAQSGAAFTRYEATNNPKTSPEKLEMEQENTCIVVYYMVKDDDFNELRCMSLFYEKRFDVRNIQDAYSTAYDYYSPDNSVTLSYNADHSTECLFNCETLGASSMQINISLMFLTSLCLLLMSYLQRV